MRASTAAVALTWSACVVTTWVLNRGAAWVRRPFTFRIAMGFTFLRMLLQDRLVEREHFGEVQDEDQPIADVGDSLEILAAQPRQCGARRLDQRRIERCELAGLVDDQADAAVAGL